MARFGEPNEMEKILFVKQFFLLAGASQDVFLLPHIPYEYKGIVYFLYITLCSYWWSSYPRL